LLTGVHIESGGVKISRVESGVRVLVGWAKTTPGPKLGARAYVCCTQRT
jgi:hypothetical protein